MRVPLNWLKDYVDISISPAELGNRLSMAGNEVKGVEIIGAGWEKIIVGQIIAIKPHPNADRLRLATVETGLGQQTIVCGAPNLFIGDKIVFASEGAELKDGHTGQIIHLKSAKIRGVESRGMICSEMELGISQNHEGIMVLSSNAPVGMPLSEYLGDSVIDLDITPNRPDCLSVIGIARECSAITGNPIHFSEVEYIESETRIEDKIAVEIRDPQLCSRYCASLITDVNIKPSPKWMQDRLIACGMRPINNIVDISNYVMLEYGQPLHTFDYDKLRGGRIIVRRADEGETIVSLDGVERKLNSNMLVIADVDRAVAVAGVMGGANTEVSEQTTNILLEAASFKPMSIHYTGDTLCLPSESRYRFERGIAPGLTLPALKRASQLIAEFGGGNIAKGWIDAYPSKLIVKPIMLYPDKLKALLGIEFTMEQIVKTLTSLGFICEKHALSSGLMVKVPYWRSDIHIQVDLIEEVARIQGYDKIPNTLLAEPLPPLNPDPIFDLKSNIRTELVAAGFSEVLNFSLVGMDMLKRLSPEQGTPEPFPLRVANPMTVDMEYLRITLRPMLLSAFSANRRYYDGSIRLFEVGKVYLPRKKDLPDERDIICSVMGGLRFDKSWQDNDKLMDFFDAKGIVENLFRRFGLEPRFEKGQDVSLHPNKQTDIFIEDRKVGVVGEVHPRVLSAFNVNESVYILEIDLKILVSFTIVYKSYHPIPRFPSTVRDMALIAAMNITHQKVKKIIQDFPLVEDVEIFDVYSGDQVVTGKKSMAYRISYRSLDHTLTDEEVDRVQQQILKRLNVEAGVVLRS